jgi:hypothetical protein
MSYSEDASDRFARNWRDSRPRRSDFRDERLSPPEGTVPFRVSTRRTPISPWLFVIVTALNTMMAAVVAVFVTLNVMRQEKPNSHQAETAPAPANIKPTIAVASEPTPVIASPQPIGLRPIGSSNQPLRLEVQKPTRLPLQIEPEEATREPFILLLSGAPTGTALSGATRIGSDTWFLPPGSSNQLEITLPEWSTSVFEITIVLRRTTGLLAAQTTAWIAVSPPVPAEPKPAEPKIDEAAAKDLLERGNRLLEKGDIVAARVVYQRAAEMGSGEAAFMLGSTYDPRLLWSRGVVGMVGNKERAREWYSRARELGNAEAKARLMAPGN